MILHSPPILQKRKVDKPVTLLALLKIVRLRHFILFEYDVLDGTAYPHEPVAGLRHMDFFPSGIASNALSRFNAIKFLSSPRKNVIAVLFKKV